MAGSVRHWVAVDIKVRRLIAEAGPGARRPAGIVAGHAVERDTDVACGCEGAGIAREGHVDLGGTDLGDRSDRARSAVGLIPRDAVVSRIADGRRVDGEF